VEAVKELKLENENEKLSSVNIEQANISLNLEQRLKVFEQSPRLK